MHLWNIHLKASVARLLDITTVWVTESRVSSSPRWESELQQQQWLSSRPYIPVRRVSIAGDCQHIQRQMHTSRKSHIVGRMKDCLSAVHQRRMSVCREPHCSWITARKPCFFEGGSAVISWPQIEIKWGRKYGNQGKAFNLPSFRSNIWAFILGDWIINTCFLSMIKLHPPQVIIVFFLTSRQHYMQGPTTAVKQAVSTCLVHLTNVEYNAAIVSQSKNFTCQIYSCPNLDQKKW